VLLLKVTTANNTEWSAINGKYFIICPAIKIPPKKTGPKLDVIFPILPFITTYKQAEKKVISFQIIGLTNFFDDYGFTLNFPLDNCNEFIKRLVNAGKAFLTKKT